MEDIPIIDVSSLLLDPNPESLQTVSAEIGEACKKIGFFYISGHNLDSLRDELFAAGRRFFEMPLAFKNRTHMSKSRVYRGYFSIGEEKTSKRSDHKEGLYFCTDLNDKDKSVQAGTTCFIICLLAKLSAQACRCMGQTNTLNMNPFQTLNG